MAPQPNLFYPEMIHFALPLHATREELIDLAAGWAASHELHVSIERFFPDYLVAAVSRGGDLKAAIAEFEPVRRICLREAPFDIVASNHVQHVAMNRESLTIVLEPLSEDGLRATALASKMGDEEKLRWWVGIVRESAAAMHRGAWAVEPGGRRKFVSDHWYTTGAYELAAAGVPMLASHGSAIFEFDAAPA
ncbi:MAG TPA: hypothetical protein VGR11_09025 [Solirubrobacteraceae bacterium]|nr:hypothetical protein [Solirubrobacteraceae bacterium]